MVGQIQNITVGEEAIYLIAPGSVMFYQNTGSAVWDTIAGFPGGLGPGDIERIGPFLFISDSFGAIWTNHPGYVGTKVVEDQQHALIFPNPFSNYFTIQFPEDLKQVDVIRVFSQNGEQLFERVNPGNSLAIATGNWASGMYYVLWNAGGQLYSEKMIKLGRE